MLAPYEDLKTACTRQADRIGSLMLGMHRQDAEMEVKIRSWGSGPRATYRRKAAIDGAARVPHQQACLLVAEIEDPTSLPAEVLAMANDYTDATALMDLLGMGRLEIEEAFRLYALIESTLDDEDHARMLPCLDETVEFWRTLRRFAAARIGSEHPYAWSLFEGHVDHDRVEELRQDAQVSGAEALGQVFAEARLADRALERLEAELEARRSNPDAYQPQPAILARFDRDLAGRRRMVKAAGQLLLGYEASA